MNFNKIINNVVLLISISLESKKIFILWLLIYIIGLFSIYTYKINNYQYDIEIKIFKQYTPMERIFPRGDDPLVFDFIKKDLSEYNVSSLDDAEGKFIEILFTIVENDKEKIKDNIEDIKLKIDKYKKKVIKITYNTNETLNKKMRNLIIDNVNERNNFYKYYFTQKYLNTLFINEYSNIFVRDNFIEKNISYVKVSLILKIFSVNILILYLLNLLFLIYLKNYRKKEFY